MTGEMQTYIFILVAGVVATDMWRWLGVLVGNRLREDSEAMMWVRAVATALVAAVIARLILHPTGTLALVPAWERVGAAVGGFAAYLAFGQRIVVGVGVAITLIAIALSYTL